MKNLVLVAFIALALVVGAAIGSRGGDIDPNARIEAVRKAAVAAQKASAAFNFYAVKDGVQVGTGKLMPERFGPGTFVFVPDCTEDEIYLRGAGDFDGVVWDRYECTHPDEVRP